MAKLTPIQHSGKNNNISTHVIISNIQRNEERRMCLLHYSLRQSL